MPFEFDASGCILGVIPVDQWIKKVQTEYLTVGYLVGDPRISNVVVESSMRESLVRTPRHTRPPELQYLERIP